MKKAKGKIKRKLVEKYFDDVSHDYFKYKYTPVHRSYMSVRQEKMLSFFDKKSINIEGKVLDAGCGPGHFMIKLLERKYRVTGIDVSRKMLELASEQINRNKLNSSVNLIVSDIESIPFRDNSFDILSTAGVIEYLDKDVKVLSEFKRVLKNNGLLIISVTNKYSYNLILDNIIEILRRNPFFFKIMNFVSEKIIGLGTLQPKTFNIRKHSPFAFKKLLLMNGFVIIDSTFFYFMPFPHPFNHLLSSVSNWAGNKLEKLGKTKLGILGEGYLLILQNKSKTIV